MIKLNRQQINAIAEKIQRELPGNFEAKHYVYCEMKENTAKKLWFNDRLVATLKDLGLDDDQIKGNLTGIAGCIVQNDPTYRDYVEVSRPSVDSIINEIVISLIEPKESLEQLINSIKNKFSK